MTKTYLPEYVHSDLENGKISLRINIDSDTSCDTNHMAVTEFCKSWQKNPEHHDDFINVDFDLKQIIDDALYAHRLSGKKYDFSDDESRKFLLQLQAELIEALVEVSNTIIESIEVTA